MSITDSIERHLGAELFLLPPLSGDGDFPRTLVVSSEVYHDVNPPFPDHWDGQRLGQFRGTLDAFTEDEYLAVAEDPHNKKPEAYFARVDPVELRIWDIRSLAPRPQIRCFGAWAKKDMFVALTWEYRDDLDFAAEACRCRKIWDRLFAPFVPFEGESLDEYLSANYYAV